MFICKECGRTFRDCATDCEDLDGNGSVQTWSCCPFCGSGEIVDAYECPACGEWHDDDELCDDCAEEIDKLFEEMIDKWRCGIGYKEARQMVLDRICEVEGW